MVTKILEHVRKWQKNGKNGQFLNDFWCFVRYELGGGGGTDFMCCWNYFKENGIVPQKFVMFTDGYPWDSWGDENYCDTLFIVHGDGYGGRTPQSPFGLTVPYERNK